VLVIGAARAEISRFIGYDRLTNPLLTASDVITLKKPHLCATYTTASVNAILSRLNNQVGFLVRKLWTCPSTTKQAIDVIATKNWESNPIKVSTTLRQGFEKNTVRLVVAYDGVVNQSYWNRLDLRQTKSVCVLHQTGSTPIYITVNTQKNLKYLNPSVVRVELNNCTQENWSMHRLIPSIQRSLLHKLTANFGRVITELLALPDMSLIMEENPGEAVFTCMERPTTTRPDQKQIESAFLCVDVSILYRPKHIQS